MSDFVIPKPSGGDIGRNAVKGTAVGNKFIEKGAYCDNAPGAAGCQTDANVRSRLISAYQQNVIVAQLQFGDALSELHMEALIEKPEDLPIWVSLAFDALSTFAGQAVGKAMAMLRKAPASSLSALDIMAGETEKQSAFMDAVRFADPTMLASMGISQGKKAATAPAAQTEDAQQSVNYLSYLSDASAMAFERQRQDPPGFATDAELVVLFHAWSAAMGHTKNQYKTTIAAKTARFKKSGAAQVGKNKEMYRDDGLVSKATYDTKLVAHMSQDPEVEPDIWLYQKKAPLYGMEKFDNAEYVPWKKVEPEFLQEAIIANQAEWGVPYEKQYTITNHAALMKDNKK